jgi:hypothetical protein
MGSRTWIKLYCDKWLDGTIRDEPLEIRAAFVDLLMLAGSGRWGDAGRIALTEKQGFPDDGFAKIIGISAQKWNKIKAVLIETERIILEDNNIILINNWAKYQSEYKRQQSYRKTDDITAKVTTKVTTKVTDEKEKEKEKEKETSVLRVRFCKQNIKG